MSHRLTYLSCNLYIILYKFCHATKCKTVFGCNQNLLKRSTAVNYVTHRILIIQRMSGKDCAVLFLAQWNNSLQKNKVVQKQKKSEKVSPRWMCKQLAAVNTLREWLHYHELPFSQHSMLCTSIFCLSPSLFHPPKQTCLLLKQTSQQFHGNKHCS